MVREAPPAAPEEPPPGALWRWALPPLLFLAALAVYWPCVNQGFVELDDDRNFTQNPFFRGLGAEQLRWMWSAHHFGHWHPLTWLTFGVDFTLFGLRGEAFHRTNLVIHALGVVAFYALALELLRWIAGWASSRAAPLALGRSQALALRACAALAAVTWGLHPLRVESVAWATERRDLLSALFLALTVWAYLRMARHGARYWSWLALALAAYAASLLSKAWGMTLPAVLLALDVFPLRRLRTSGRAGWSWSALLVEKLAFAPLALYAAFQAASAQREVGAAMSLAEHGVLERLAQASYGLCFYVLKTLWPSELSCSYLLEMGFTPGDPQYVAAMVAVALATLALLALARRFPGGLATWFVFVVLVSPVLGLLQSGTQKVADRYAHVCSMALSIALAGALLTWIARRPRAGTRRAAAWAVLAAAALFGGVLGIAAQRQTRVWQDSETLFRRALEVEPQNYFVAHNMAVMRFRAGDYAEAARFEQLSVDAHPAKGNETARLGLASTQLMLNRPEQAEQAWRGALEWEPQPGDPRWRLGARFWYPDPSECLRELGSRLRARGAHDELIALYRKGLARRPDVAALYSGLGRLLLERGRAQEAYELWDKTARSRVPLAAVENGLGNALAALARLGEAETHLVRAVQLENTNRDYVVDVCEVFFRQGRFADALQNVQQVLAQEPGHARANDLNRRARAALGQR